MRKTLVAALAALLSVTPLCASGSAGSVSLSSMDALIAAVEHSAAVTVTSYVLPPNSALARALVRAAQRGSDVVLVLDSETVGAGAQQSVQETVETLSHEGVKIRLTRNPSHIKSALIDHRVVYLSDRNFTSAGGMVVVSDDPDDYNAVVDAIYHGPIVGSNHLRVYKRDALALEAQLLASGSGPCDIETESLSAGNPAFYALEQRARSSPVRLIVSGDELYDGRHEREAQQLDALNRLGVQVRVGTSNEKLLVQAGEGFIGSANMSGGSAAVQGQPDWGMAVEPGPLMEALRSRFESDWALARPPR